MLFRIFILKLLKTTTSNLLQISNGNVQPIAGPLLSRHGHDEKFSFRMWKSQQCRFPKQDMNGIFIFGKVRMRCLYGILLYIWIGSTVLQLELYDNV